MKHINLGKVLYPVFVLSNLLLSLRLLAHGIINYDWHDFDVFYNAAASALAGNSIYIIIGQYHLPFWYFPWTAWFYIPYAIWPAGFALILYQGTSILCAIFIVRKLTKYYRPDFIFLDSLLIFSLIIPMSLQLMIVGQMDYILLALIVITMVAIEQKKDILAGVLLPFLWAKPHLLIVFTLFAFWRAGKRTVFISLVFSALMLLLETIISPGWYFEMINLLHIGSQRTDGLKFTTLPNFLGFQENWVGTANLPFTIILIALAILITWRFRSLPTLPLLSFALTASLFCAPRAYAYDLPLLIPSMIWMTAKEFKSNSWLWFSAAMIPLLTGFSSSAYLVTLVVFLLSIWKAHNTLRQPVPLEIAAQ